MCLLKQASKAKKQSPLLPSTCNYELFEFAGVHRCLLIYMQYVRCDCIHCYRVIIKKSVLSDTDFIFYCFSDKFTFKVSSYMLELYNDKLLDLYSGKDSTPDVRDDSSHASGIS